MRVISLVSFFVLSIPAAAGAQAVRTDPSYRDPGTATIYSVVLPGGGQLYSGETGRGLAMLVGSSAAILAGSALSTSASCDYNASSPYGLSCREANNTPLTIGMLASLGIWGYGIFDAKKSAARQNLKRSRHSLAIEPLMKSVSSRTIIGVNLGF